MKGWEEKKKVGEQERKMVRINGTDTLSKLLPFMELLSITTNVKNFAIPLYVICSAFFY